MSQQQGYVIREWGNGFWKWSCTGQGRGGKHSGIVGPPATLEDAQRLAAAHWAEAHAALPAAGDVRPAPSLDEPYPSSPPERTRHEDVALSLVERLRQASEQRRGV